MLDKILFLEVLFFQISQNLEVLFLPDFGQRGSTVIYLECCDGPGRIFDSSALNNISNAASTGLKNSIRARCIQTNESPQEFITGYICFQGTNRPNYIG